MGFSHLLRNQKEFDPPDNVIDMEFHPLAKAHEQRLVFKEMKQLEFGIVSAEEAKVLTFRKQSKNNRKTP